MKPLDADERTFLLILSSIILGVNRFPTQNVFQQFRNAHAVFGARERDLLDIEGMPPSAVKKILTFELDDSFSRQLEEIDREGVQVLPFYSEYYPQNLRTIRDPPPVLYVRGALEGRDTQAVAVIGSRRATTYGIEACQLLTSALVGKGFHIVSGMAIGIDSIAHWSAIENQGKTVGVLGTGVDIAYPKSNAALYGAVLEKGAVVSEFPMGTKPYPEHFPRRNRIISGLSLGVLVVEASERSGTMSTVRMALEQGREVFAVPGDIRSEKSRGTHKLIKQGAKLVDRIEDILDELNVMTHAAPADRQASPMEGNMIDKASPEKVNTLTKKARASVDSGGHLLCQEAMQVLRVIGSEGISLDRIIARSGLSPARVAGLLTELEMCGKVRPVAGNRFRRVE